MIFFLTRNTLFMLIAFVFSGTVLYFSYIYKHDAPSALLDSTSSPDTYLKNSELIAYQKNGQMKLKIETRESSIQNSMNQTKFKSPTLLLEQENSSWNVKANSAETDNHYNNIDLYGDVKAISMKKQKADDSDLPLRFNQNEQIEIRSHEAHHHHNTRHSEFLGNVRAKYDEHFIRCEKLTVNEHNEFFELSAQGSSTQRALYRSISKKNKSEWVGKAQSIFYDSKMKRIIFRGHVELTQNKQYFSGETIIYDISTEVITVPKHHQAESILIFQPNSKRMTS